MSYGSESRCSSEVQQNREHLERVLGFPRGTPDKVDYPADCCGVVCFEVVLARIAVAQFVLRRAALR